MQTPPPVPNLLARLSTFAANCESVLTSQDGNIWSKRPSNEQWSLTEICCHLRDVEREVYHSRFQNVIAEENAFIPGASPDEWAEERGYAQQDGPAALRAFLTARGETIEMLQDVPAELWSRQGQHAFFGPTSLHELLYLAVRHDDLHWEQIRALL
jgi:hypothetical protein